MVISKVNLILGISVIISIISMTTLLSNLNPDETKIADARSSNSRDHIHPPSTNHNQSHHSPLHNQQQSPSVSTQKPSLSQLLPSSNSKTTTSDNSPGILPAVPSNFNKVVILTFGDGYQSQYTIAKPILDRYGYKGNFFVTCNKVGTANKMTWPELSQLYQGGNVIGSKTVDYGTKAMEGKDLNHLTAQQLEFEVGQSKQCLVNNGINTDYFAVPMNLADDNATVINEIAKYYTLAINGHSNLMYLHCNGQKEISDQQSDCRTYLDNGDLNPQNRYSIGEWSEQHIKNGNSFNDQQMFAKFIAVVNSQDKFNINDVNTIPLIAYHDIVLLPDITLSSKPSATTLNLFNTEMQYLHDNGFNVLTFNNLGYDDKNNIFYLKV
jgi:peptidoglycan/xylan/chitin deacetylase (PgdA/CDA1 family)